MIPRAVTWPVALWVALGLNKLALLAYTLLLGKWGGQGALGVHTSLVTAAGLAGGLLHAGLPDWALYRAAESRAAGEALPRATGGAHALFLLSAAVAYAGLAAGLPWVVPEPSLRAYGALVVLGLFLPHLSAFALSTLRGLGEPRPEALAAFASAAVMAAGTFVAGSTVQLGGAFALAGACLLFPLSAGLRGPARPHLGTARDAAGWLRKSVPYLALGLGWQLLWATDTLVTRVFSGNDEVGLLAAAALVLRGGLYGASLFGALLVHRVRAGETGARPLLLGLGPVLAGVGVAASWALHGVLARHFGISPDALRPVLLAASCVAPLAYTATLWMPVAIGLAPARARRALALGLAVALPVGFALRSQGAVGGMVALSVGQAVLLALLGPVVLGAAVARAETSAAE